MTDLGVRSADEVLALRAVFDRLDQGIVAYGADLRLIVCNRKAREILGYSKDEPAPGDHLEDIVRRRIRQSDFGDIADTDGYIQDVVDRAKLNRAYTEVRRLPDGTVLDVQSEPLDGGGFISTYIDVTDRARTEDARRQSDERYRLLIQAMPVGMAIVQDGIIALANPAMARILGVTNVDGHRMDEFIAGTDEHPLILGDGPVTARAPTPPIELRLISSSGDLVPVLASRTAVHQDGRLATLFMFGDLTALKHAEAQLAESETHVKEITNVLPFPLTRISPDERFLFVNPSGAAWYKKKQKDVIGKKVVDVLGEELTANLRFHWNKAFQGKTSVFETRASYPDGQDRDVRITYLPNADENGHVKEIIGFVYDLTALRRAEEDADVARRRLEEAVQTVEHGVAVYDEQDRLIVWNAAFSQLNARIADKLRVGAQFADLLKEIVATGQVPESIGREEEWMAERQAQHGSTEPQERMVSDGEWYRVTERNTPSGGIVGMWTNITELKHRERALQISEQRLKAIIDQTPAGVVLKDAAGHIQYINTLASTWYGVSAHPSSTLGTLEGLDPVDGPALTDEELGVLETRAGMEVEIEDRFVDGSLHNLTVRRFPVIGPDAQPIGVGTMSIDVTDQRKIEQQLRESQKMEAIGQLTGGIAHDFNNLLTPVLGNLQLLEDGVSDNPEDLELVTESIAAIQRGAELTRRLLAFARKQPLAPQPININELVESMDSLIRRTIGANIDLRAVAAVDPWFAKADPNQLENALLNLVINARDAISSTGKDGTIIIETENVVLDGGIPGWDGLLTIGDYVMLSVSDNGIGMTQDVQDRVFEPFFTTKSTGQGTGLGLSMVFGFVKQSSGAVNIYSEAGQGTTVRLYFPRSASTETRRLTQAERTAKLPRGTETILVVEDEGRVRDFVVRALEKLGYTVIAAQDGPTALSLLEDQKLLSRLSLLFTDMVLPGGMDGTQIKEAVRALRPDLPCLYTSGYSAALLNRAGGVDDTPLLTKPYSLQTLATEIRSAIEESDNPSPA